MDWERADSINNDEDWKELDNVVRRLICDSGLVKDHKEYMKTYKQTVIGNELIKWAQGLRSLTSLPPSAAATVTPKEQPKDTSDASTTNGTPATTTTPPPTIVPVATPSTPPTTTALGFSVAQRLVDAGMLVHFSGERRIIDDRRYYSIVPLEPPSWYESLCVNPGDDEGNGSSGVSANGTRQVRSQSAAVALPPPAITRNPSPSISSNSGTPPSSTSSLSPSSLNGKWMRTFKQGATRKGETLHTGSMDLIGQHRVMRVLAVLINKDKALLLFRDPSMSMLVGQWKMDKSWRYHSSPAPHHYLMIYRKSKPELPQLIFRIDPLSREGWARALNGIGIKEKKKRLEMLGPIGLAKAKAKGGHDEKDADDDDDGEDTGTPAPEDTSGSMTPVGPNPHGGSFPINGGDGPISPPAPRRELASRSQSNSASNGNASSVLGPNGTANLGNGNANKEGANGTSGSNSPPSLDRVTSIAVPAEEKELMSPASKRAQLRDIVGVPHYEAVFKQFMKKTFCEESYLFLEAAQAYRLSSAPLPIRSAYALNIFDTFIRAQARSYVNIDAATQHQIQARVEKKQFGRDLFVQAETVITRMLENDVFRRFTGTNEYREMMDAGNVPTIPTAAPTNPSNNPAIAGSGAAKRGPRGSLTPSTLTGATKAAANSNNGPPISGPGLAQAHGRSPSGTAMVMRRPSFSMIAAEDDLHFLMDIERNFRKSPLLVKKPAGPTFDGAALVTWLMKEKHCVTRLAGESIGQRLMDALLLRGEDGRRTFVDAPFLYHLFDEWHLTADKIPEMVKGDEAGEVLVKGARYSRWFMILHEASSKLFCYLPMEDSDTANGSSSSGPASPSSPSGRVLDRWTPDSAANAAAAALAAAAAGADEFKSHGNSSSNSNGMSTPQRPSVKSPQPSPTNSGSNGINASPQHLSTKSQLPPSPFASPRLGPASPASPTPTRPALRKSVSSAAAASASASSPYPDYVAIARGTSFTRYAFPGAVPPPSSFANSNGSSNGAAGTTVNGSPSSSPTLSASFASNTPPSPSSGLHHSGSSPSLTRRGSGPHVTTVPAVTGGNTERVYLYYQPAEGKGFLHWTPSRRQDGHLPTPAQLAEKQAAAVAAALASNTAVPVSILSRERRSPSMDLDTNTPMRFGAPQPLSTISEKAHPPLHITPPNSNNGAPVLMINTSNMSTTPAPLSSPSNRNSVAMDLSLRRSGPTVAHGGHSRSRSLTSIVPVTHTIDLDDISVNIRVGRVRTAVERAGQVDTTVDPQCCSAHEGRCLSVLVAAAPATPEYMGYSEEELHIEPEHDVDFGIWLNSLLAILGRSAANSFDGALPTTSTATTGVSPSVGRVMSFEQPSTLVRPPSTEPKESSTVAAISAALSPESSPLSPRQTSGGNAGDGLTPSAPSSTASSSTAFRLAPSKGQELKEKKKQHKKSHTVAFGLPSAGSLKDLRNSSSITSNSSSGVIDMEEMAARFGEARLVVDLKGTTGRLLEDPFATGYTCYLYLDTQLPAYPILLRLDERSERDRWVAAFNRVGIKFKVENIEEYIPDEIDPSGLSGAGMCQVFLGGSCNPTTWRRDIAVPELTKHKITFYNPQVENWSPALMRTELKYKEQSSVLFFVIDDQTRAIASMVEVAEYLSRDRYMVVVIKDIPEGTNIAGQIVAGQELLDLNRGRAFLRECVQRHPKFALCCSTVEEALQHTIAAINSGAYDPSKDSHCIIA